MPAQAQRLQFAVTDYHRMVDAGILAEDDRVELIEGEILQMPPVGPEHAGRVNILNRHLSLKLGERVIVAVQNPIQVNDFSEPEPDLAILQPREDFYVQGHPRPEDVFWLIEVSDSSLTFDREVKLPLYARNGVAEVWVVNVPGAVVEVYRAPAGGEFLDRSTLRRGDSLSPRAFPDLVLAVETILG